MKWGKIYRNDIKKDVIMLIGGKRHRERYRDFKQRQ